MSRLHEGEPHAHGPLRIWDRVGRENGARAISLRVLELESGRSPALSNRECDEVFYVLGGRGLVHQGDRAEELEPDTGFYLPPGSALELENHGSQPLLLVSSRCPEPPAPRELPAPVYAAALRPLALVRLRDQSSEPSADRSYRTLVGQAQGSTRVTQFVGAIPPGRAPDHYHTYEEVLCILRGTGRMWAGVSSTPIGPGSCIYLPRGQVHCVENTGAEELVLLGVFYPAGSPAVSYSGGLGPDV